MAYNTPAQTAEAAVESGAAKASLPVSSMLVGGFLAGAYIAFGGLLAIDATAGLKSDQWGGLITLFTGLVFSLGLILVVVGGGELLTGNMMTVTIAMLSRRVSAAKLAANWFWLFVSNLAGALFVAYVLADKTGVVGTAASKAGTAPLSNYSRLVTLTVGKAVTETHLEQFLRAVGCNWLVCLAVWLALAAHDVAGKILAIILPITAFVALGFDHVVANMFFLPLAMMQHVPGVTLARTVENLIFAFLGNAVGAGLFVACAYWFTYLRVRPGAVQTAPGASEGRSPAEPALGRR